MIREIKMPSAGQTTDEALVSQWKVAIGDSVKRGDVLVEVETDKAMLPVESFAEGIVLDIMAPEGETISAGTVLCVVGSQEDQASYQASAAVGSTKAEAPVAAEQSAAGESVKAIPAAKASVAEEEEYQPILANQAPRTKAAASVAPASATSSVTYPAMPAAKKLAKEMGLSLMGIQPANGQFLKAADVEEAAKHPVAASAQVTSAQATSAQAASAQSVGYEDRKLSGIRKAIARNMHESLSTMAQLTHNTSFDATAIMTFRSQLKAAAQGGLNVPSITLNDILIYATARVLKNHPALNAHFLGDAIRYFDHVHMGMAVDTPRGLLVPTITFADEKSLSQIALETKALAAACQDGSIRPEQMSGASFTISNLGTFGIEHFTPVINPPQTGILGVDCITERITKKDGQLDTYPAMGLSLTYDHRALDGAPASRFLQELCRSLENFSALLIG